MRDNDDSLLDKMRNTLDKWAGEDANNSPDSQNQTDKAQPNPTNDEYGPEFYDPASDTSDDILTDTDPAVAPTDPNDNDMGMYEEELYIATTPDEDDLEMENSRASEDSTTNPIDNEEKREDKPRDDTPML
jgi:hypothetical protein